MGHAGHQMCMKTSNVQSNNEVYHMYILAVVHSIFPYFIHLSYVSWLHRIGDVQQVQIYMST